MRIINRIKFNKSENKLSYVGDVEHAKKCFESGKKNIK